jgi:hypothetical protein
MLIDGVEKQAVMEIFGWSRSEMVDRYQHVPSVMTAEALRRVGSRLRGERRDVG